MPTQVYVESYINKKAGHIDELRVDGEFEISRVHKAAYLIKAADKYFVVTVADGAKSSVIAFQGPKSNIDPDLTIELDTGEWPEAISTMRANYNGYFHLERNTPNEYFFGTRWDAYHFRTISGPSKQQLVVMDNTP